MIVRWRPTTFLILVGLARTDRRGRYDPVMKRQAGTVTLQVRGRDIEETEKALQFDKTACRWSILGAAAEVNRSAERKR